ncbi:MAG: undecaprenyl-diphosphate phosphatase [Bacteroidia bacterium]|nr:undecaprenyl-diphosphate phosphatase [Bacteroidia bacterium]MCZ2140150.1 undecaprenyl-diphosphate phosphatase [Bacteroidia bacterium]
MSYFEAILLAIVEGLTEFLPVSSTGHMVLTSSVLGIAENEFVKMFTVAIQFGAILSVLVLYWKRFFQSISFYTKLFIAFLPAAVIGFLFNDYIDMILENPIVVAISLLLGGIVLLFVDNWFAENETNGITEISNKNAWMIGVFQVISMIPGVSRSAATIIGGLSQKLTRKAAAEFSFFLAVPTMFAATGYKMLKYQMNVGFNTSDIGVLAIGNIAAFIVAIIAIKGFIGFLTKYGFKMFGWYRIALGAIIIALYAFGYELKMI